MTEEVAEREEFCAKVETESPEKEAEVTGCRMTEKEKRWGESEKARGRKRGIGRGRER